ncbi:succinate dehydrogenase / fumarate reductase cytochrome b subunit [Mesorhizobium sp. YL-MeA3-2017]|jgi:succinate dehydrogenase / fumarate reductase cytochrome b subunit|uniref:succinate dehydrogenase, cytochrome b556 subunit n=1 Tax=Mesorhizobium sp. YL-MeA3-2017 TaxID=3042284 RepID=UPI0015CDAFBE|nr:succinate dehydrogenase, cytochrome b556 subunit [Mesorhizobium sp. YL-MeA3-2017]MDQ0333476.1 succinate dehydrogenase / fumarate reductase cytochrome b subunit [Mesorhizobium sp. YL-MeA3-2017]
MSPDRRPLSPHIQIYRPQLTSVLSITHRLTGVALGVGSIIIVAWLVTGAAGQSAYQQFLGILRSWIGLALLFGWTFSMFFHLCNGVRHLFWDAGRGFDLRTIYASGWAVIATSVILTIVLWTIGLFIAPVRL